MIPKRSVFYPWSGQGQISPTTVAGADGCWFWDDQGNRWLDLHSQLGNLHLGHQHPELVAAIQDQASQMCTIAPSFAVDVREQAAQAILDVSPGFSGASQVFFTTGGADANEHALRMAMLATGRHKVLAAHRSYHGATAGAMSVTGDARRWAVDPIMSHHTVRFFGPYQYRSEFHSTNESEECSRALAHLSSVIDHEGPHTVAALIIEPVVGSNGVLVPPDGYLAGVRTLCNEHDILLIADEVMTGFGRCGDWFACDSFGVTPDLLTFAKGVNSGYVPLGGVVLGPRVADFFTDRPYPGGLTYSGHPLACASALASINILERDKLVSSAQQLGEEVVRPALLELAQRHISVGEVRGLGLAWAIELVSDRQTRKPFAPLTPPGSVTPLMKEVLDAAKSSGAWPLAVANRLHLFPPLTISSDELDHGIAAIDSALTKADELVQR